MNEDQFKYQQPQQENGIPIIFIRTFMKIFMRNTRMSISLCTMILMNCRT